MNNIIKNDKSPLFPNAMLCFSLPQSLYINYRLTDRLYSKSLFHLLCKILHSVF